MFVELYTISSSQMEAFLYKGDRVVVNKTAYGVRLPITPLAVPFVADELGGRRTYLSSLVLPYKRILPRKVAHNDIVLFNNPIETNKPLDRRSLLVSRCIALPGEKVKFEGHTLYINNKEYVYSPDFSQEYFINDKGKLRQDEINSILEKYDIPLHNYRRNRDSVFVKMSNYQAFVFDKNTSDSIHPIVTDSSYYVNYELTIPKEGMVVELTGINIETYAHAILSENPDATVRDNKLYINGKEQQSYMFHNDYYWFLSDNATNLLDSRSLGFIPFTHIIGRISYVWYSSKSQVSSIEAIQTN